MRASQTLREKLDRLQRISLAAGLIASAAIFLGLFWARAQFFRSYLLSYLFWFDVALGCFGAVMLHNLVGGGWGQVIRRFLGSATRTIPFMGILFIPVLFGMQDLYVWARPEAVAADHLLQHKAPYLNATGFVGRAVLYFAIWGGLAYFIGRWEEEGERTGRRVLSRRLQLISAPGLVLYFLALTFASIDWAMSTQPEWYSSIYGAIFLSGQGIAALAFAILLLGSMSAHEPFKGVLAPSHFHDLGNLTLAFVMLWTYMSFSQFLIIWMGNLPHENVWYIHRSEGGWQWVAAFLAVFHFAVPFLLLLFRGIKRAVLPIGALAAALLALHWVSLYWLVVPAFHPGTISLHWMDAAAFISIGGIWFALFLWKLKEGPLLSAREPHSAEAESHG
jgi:hypothetical protein